MEYTSWRGSPNNTFYKPYGAGGSIQPDPMGTSSNPPTAAPSLLPLTGAEEDGSTEESDYEGWDGESGKAVTAAPSLGQPEIPSGIMDEALIPDISSSRMNYSAETHPSKKATTGAGEGTLSFETQSCASTQKLTEIVEQPTNEKKHVALTIRSNPQQGTSGVRPIAALKNRGGGLPSKGERPPRPVSGRKPIKQRLETGELARKRRLPSHDEEEGENARLSKRNSY